MRRRCKQLTRKAVDRGLCPAMAMLSLVFLALLAVALTQLDVHHIPGWIVDRANLALSLLWPLFFVETVARVAVLDEGARGWKRLGYQCMICLMPPLRLGLTPATSGSCIWLPRLGWQRPDRDLRKRLERAFSGPMMIIAAMILPVLAVDLMWWEQVRDQPWLSITLDVATRLIWLAFAVEFFIILAVATRKVRYCTEHWVDVAIILLPFISFLRIARVLRAGQIFRGGRMVQLARTYRLRGLLTRVVRALLLLRLIERYSPWAAEKRLGGLKDSLARKEEELEELRQEIRELEADLADRREQRRAAAQAGRPGATAEGPAPAAAGSHEGRPA